jgi:HEAT repeat protein
MSINMKMQCRSMRLGVLWLQLLPISLLSLFPVVVPVGMARSAEVIAPKNTSVEINRVERLILLQREGAISALQVSDAIDRLASAHDHPTVAAFLIQLLKNEESFIRSDVADRLGQMRRSAKLVIPQLVLLLKDADPQVRRGAASGLGRIGKSAESTVPQLIPLLEDPDRWVRCSAAQTLGLIGEPAKVALRPLIRQLANDSGVRDCTAFALGRIEPFLKDEENLRVKP